MTRPKGWMGQRRLKRLVTQVADMRVALERVEATLAELRRKLAGLDG